MGKIRESSSREDPSGWDGPWHLIALGARGLPPSRARVYWALNATTLLVIVMTAGYVGFYALYDAPTFWREAGFLAATICAYLAVFLCTFLQRPFVGLVVLVSIGLAHLGVATWLLGRESGAFFYLLVIPVLVALSSEHRRLWIIWPVATLSACLFLVLSLYRPEGSMVLLPDWIVLSLLAADVFGSVLLAAILAYVFRRLVHNAETALEQERQRSDRLLQAILPQPVAERLKKDHESEVAEEFE
ncbi:hypothetical protein AB9K41_07805, partial [Cribrihabitans sp. XS_ASV171]